MKFDFFKQISIKESIALVIKLIENKFKGNSSPNQRFKTIYDQLSKKNIFFEKSGSDTLIKGYLINDKPIDFFIRRNTSDIDVFKQILIEEEFSPLIKLILKLKLSHESFIVIDAGGNVGFVSLYLSKFLKISKLIIIEPVTQNIQYLTKNLNLNKINNYHLIEGGLHFEDATLALDNSFRDGGFWAVNLTALTNSKNRVPVYSLQTIKANLNVKIVDILKIDIEGGEKGLFDQTDLSWLDNVRIVTIEVHEEFISNMQVKDCLIKKGFKVIATGELLIGYKSSLE